LHSGVIVVEWGDGLFQDIDSGEFVRVPGSQISHTAQNPELELLKRSGHVDQYDAHQAWFINLPERPIRSIE